MLRNNILPKHLAMQPPRCNQYKRCCSLIREGGAGVRPGMLAASRSGLVLLESPCFDVTQRSPALPRRKQLLRWRLAGDPCAWATLGSARRMVVADAGGGLHAVAFGDGPATPRGASGGGASGRPETASSGVVTCFRVTAADDDAEAAACTCIAASIAYLPAPGAAGGSDVCGTGAVAMDTSSDDAAADALAGALFLGSRTTASQLRAVTAGAVASLCAASAGASLHPTAAHPARATGAAGSDGVPAALQLPMLEAQHIRSLAPIQDAVPFRDPACPGETQLLVASGIAPGGRLSRARTGACLTPYLTDGPELPGDVEIFAFKARHGDEHDAYLAFSFVAAGRTDVMDVSSADVRQASLGGLDAGSPSLLVATLPGDWLLQVSGGISCQPLHLWGAFE